MLTVIGFAGGQLPPEAAPALSEATLVVGGARHLAAVDSLIRPDAERLVLGSVPAAVARLAGYDRPAVVVASGDPGFFGIVRALRRAGLTPAVIPAISSVAYAFARLAMPWDDALVVSAHGRDLRRVVNVCRAYPKVAVLTGPGAGPRELAAALRGLPRRLVVCSRLGTGEERISGPDQALEPNVTLVLGPDAHDGHDAHDGPGTDGAQDTAWTGGPARWLAGRVPGPAGWALPEESFHHRDSMITKAEVRALVLARIGPRPGDLVWDVGAGSGSVAVECARLGAGVIAVERDADACRLVAENARAHGVDVLVVTGAAPAALADLPEPDAVFVGGGGPSALAGVLTRRPPRIVAAFVGVERVGPALTALSASGYRADGSQLQANRLVAVPGGDGGHRLAATNPVYVVWGELVA